MENNHENIHIWFISKVMLIILSRTFITFLMTRDEPARTPINGKKRNKADDDWMLNVFFLHFSGGET